MATQNVSIDKDFARFGSKSYAINKINSVDIREVKPHGIAGAIIFGLLAVFLIFGVATSVSTGKPVPESIWFFLVLFVALAVWQYLRSKIVEYKLFLTTSSSENQALTTREAGVVERLRDQIEAAMATSTGG